ncbi:regulatory domain of a methyltransferase-containing protein [Burkholderia sp. YR290]|jgi:methyltransferase-like protein|uniref:class I SAM-dependent methyltransferase n=1 Tax=Paraburkholderia hospita TaxID=169430 RepID=UPI0009A7FA05|nr:class I SAM-dependent methyltransferase [Paraburkholderia hospita]SKC90082.1 regulatory domain of a methyltransferase-containing protein [Paraburkholderia hospita]SOE86243.1 regulatory domain of a methyltransferase-containing protein [Burkholderia sp. YR290]
MDTTQHTNEIEQNYDDNPYYSFSYEQSAPEHLAAVAHVFGLSAPDVSKARVLELGCAAGRNLIPFAVRNPGARAIGVDLSGAQVQEGRQNIKRLKLKNVELRQQDLTTLGEVDGKFDYIICHGVYSWVPQAVQQAILRVCSENLSADGIAYLGYKTYPGWKSREIVRDAMLLRAGELKGAGERLAHGRGMIDFLREHARKDSVLARAVEQDHEMINNNDAGFSAYVNHDYLALSNAPCYFQDFTKRIDEHGLAYLADANLPSMFASNYGDEIGRLLLAECGHSQVLTEQYLDFVSDRAFRTSLIVHKERAGGIHYRVEHERLHELHLAASLKCADSDVRMDDSPQRFDAENGSSIILNHAIDKAAAIELERVWPFTMSFDELKRDVRTRLGNDAALPDTDIEARLDVFFNAMVVRGLGRFRVHPLTRSSGNARLHAAVRHYPAGLPRGQMAHTFNPWHQPVQMDAVTQLLLPHIDGSRNEADLLGILSKAVEKGALTVSHPPGESGEAGERIVLARELERALKLLCA